MPQGFAAAPHELQQTMRLYPAFERALQSLPPETVLEVFEKEDPLKLSANAWLMGYLRAAELPFFQLTELADLLTEFRDHLTANAESLETSGYPTASFERSIWLERQGLVYPTKVPLSFFTDGKRDQPVIPDDSESAGEQLRGIPRDANGNLIYSFFWGPEVHPQDSASPEITYRRCSYADAPAIKGCPEKHQAVIEPTRGAVLSLYTEILRVCVLELFSDEEWAVWKATRQILQQAAPPANLQEFLNYDECARRSSAALSIGRASGQDGRFRPDTISSILGIVCHCERERQIGAYDKLKEPIAAILPLIPRGGSYFDLLGQPMRAELDRDLAKYWSRAGREAEFARRFAGKLNSYLRTGVAQSRTDEAYRIATETELAAIIERGVERVLATRYSSRPTNHLPVSAQQDSSPQNAFHRRGEYWEITFQGITVPIKDKSGMLEIAFLLQRPTTPVSCSDLDRLTGGNHPGSPQIPEELGLHPESSRDIADLLPGLETMDAAARADITREIRELQLRMDVAHESGNAAEAFKAQEALLELQLHLKKELGLGGRPRSLGGTKTAIRNKITMRIARAIKHIRKHNKSLALHLKAAVRTGGDCRYSPEHPTPWIIKT